VDPDAKRPNSLPQGYDALARRSFVLLGSRCLVRVDELTDDGFAFSCLTGDWKGRYDMAAGKVLFDDRSWPGVTSADIAITCCLQPPADVRTGGYSGIVRWMRRQASGADEKTAEEQEAKNASEADGEDPAGLDPVVRNGAIARLLSDADARIDALWHLGGLVGSEGFSIAVHDDLVEAMIDRDHPSMEAFLLLGGSYIERGLDAGEDLSFRLLENGLTGFVARVSTPVPRNFSKDGTMWNSSWGYTRAVHIYADSFEDVARMAVGFAEEVLGSARAKALAARPDAAARELDL